MTSLLHRYVPQTEFDSYEAFREKFRINVPENFNFAYDIVDTYAATVPEKTALIWCDDQGNEKIISFGELKILSDKAANLLRSHGIGKGDAVILTLKSRYEFWIAIIALHKLGAVTVPATHMLKKRDIVYRLEKTRAKAVISIDGHDIPSFYDEAEKETGMNLKKFIVGKADGWIDFCRGYEEASPDFVRPTGEQAVKNTDPMIYYFSSGTAGYPKMVAHDFVYPLGHIITARYWQNVQEDGIHYTHADSGWGKCVWGKLYGQWICGTTVLVYDASDRFNAADMLEKVSKYGVTTFCAPPTVYRFLIKEDLSKYDYSSLKYCVVAGEALNSEVYDKFLKFTGIRLMEGFGQTETIVSIATYPWMEPKPGSMGKPTAGYNIDIVAPDGRSCDVGEEGEIVIRTGDCVIGEDGCVIGRSPEYPPGLFCGYKTDPEKTRKAWHDGYYHTGDTAWKDEDGYFWFVGRTDDIIKSSGYKIGPVEVESALIQHPGVLECAVTGVPDEVRGQVVKATIVLTPAYKEKIATPEGKEALILEIQNHTKNITAPYKYPRVIEFTDELPKTISGKIRHSEIRDRDKKA